MSNSLFKDIVKYTLYGCSLLVFFSVIFPGLANLVDQDAPTPCIQEEVNQNV